MGTRIRLQAQGLGSGLLASAEAGVCGLCAAAAGASGRFRALALWQEISEDTVCPICQCEVGEADEDDEPVTHCRHACNPSMRPALCIEWGEWMLRCVLDRRDRYHGTGATVVRL